MFPATLSRAQSHVRTALTFGVRNWLSIASGRQVFQLTSKHALHPLECRRGTSDLTVFRQVFVKLEYSPLAGDPGFILDCGANVGYTSAYFLTRYPRAEVIAVEPDPDNFKVLARNLAPYGSRARPIHAAIWSHSTRLSLADPHYRGGAECARQVRECTPDEARTVPAFGIADILRLARRDRIDILKVDIEGAEAVVFAHGQKEWLDQVGVIAVELHDDTSFGPSTDIVTRATQEFLTSQSGELTFCRRPTVI